MNKKEVTNEELARMIAKGFEHTASKDDLAGVKTDLAGVKIDMAGVKADIADIKEHLGNVEFRLGRVERDVLEIKEDMVRRYEFDDLMSRVKYMETKMGIKSGK
jgi:archaellum component FlaC